MLIDATVSLDVIRRKLDDSSEGFHQTVIRSLLLEAGADTSLLDDFPIDVFGIVRSLGGNVVEQRNLPVDGLLMPKGSGFTVFVNADHLTQRQRFSCAHEIAHWILDPRVPAKRTTANRESAELEGLCEKFASSLLMPDKEFSLRTEELGSSIRSIEKLAYVYGTSIQATALRLVNVVDQACAVVISERRNTDSTMRVRWAHTNGCWPKQNRKIFIPPGKTVNNATVRLAYQTGNIQRDEEDIDLGNFKVRSYTESKAFGTRDRRYVLSLIIPRKSQ